MIQNQTRFYQAIAGFDAANGQDPNIELVDGQAVPKELLYAQRMTRWLHATAPDAPEAVQLAARCQHIRRWTIPRADFPTGRDGYLQWRAGLARFHAETAAVILREVGYDEAMIAKVEQLLRKRQLKTDADVQLLEDVICLVFLENYFAEFSTQFDEDKVIDIVRKTWAKMSPRGHAAALELELSPVAAGLVAKAVAE
jgi:hypothetical protein